MDDAVGNGAYFNIGIWQASRTASGSGGVRLAGFFPDGMLKAELTIRFPAEMTEIVPLLIVP